MLNELPPLPQPEQITKKRLQGLSSRAKGKAFEDRLDATFAYYASRGYALIDKTPEPFKIIKRLEYLRFIGCFQKKAQPDYKGTIKGGRSVVFEAKYTDSDRIQQDRVSEAQWSYMEQATELGARCFVICGFRSGKVYKVPWAVWRTMKETFGHKYMAEKDIACYKVAESWNDLLLVLD